MHRLVPSTADAVPDCMADGLALLTIMQITCGLLSQVGPCLKNRHPDGTAGRGPGAPCSVNRPHLVQGGGPGDRGLQLPRQPGAHAVVRGHHVPQHHEHLRTRIRPAQGFWVTLARQLAIGLGTSFWVDAGPE